MTTCNRFDRGPDGICRTCGRDTVFYPSKRHPGDGHWEHVGPTVADKLADLERRRRPAAIR